MTALTASGLTEQQRELVKYLVVDGKPPEEAAKLAGYHPKSAYRTLRLPAVAAAISETIQLDLASVGAPLAYRVAKSLLQDEAVRFAFQTSDRTTRFRFGWRINSRAQSLAATFIKSRMEENDHIHDHHRRR